MGVVFMPATRAGYNRVRRRRQVSYTSYRKSQRDRAHSPITTQLYASPSVVGCESQNAMIVRYASNGRPTSNSAMVSRE